MGTNYYLFPEPPCEHCGRLDPPLHVGKSSAGWCFSLHVIPEQGLNTLEDWIKLWSKPGVFTNDEYGRPISIEDLHKKITVRKSVRKDGSDPWESLPMGYSDWNHFHRSNQSEKGPDGLLRHRIDGVHCVGHGEGTYDYIQGEFC